ncbi:DNA-binding protein RFX7-like [Montipora capricornis]|uniref:DNA-binding protein RFX7-like n=1 Tax=Montipora capricornis TaxID=246305 RepID=UPI0035F14E00
MHSPSEAIIERSKHLIATTPGSVDITSGTHSELLQSSAISISLKTAASPSSVDCEAEETDGPNAGLEQALKSSVSKEIQERIKKILEEVQQLSDTEKLLLYLRLPGETASDSIDDFDQNQSLPISTTRAEQTQAFHWIRCHLEECDNNSTLPKHEVYDEYKAHCESMNAARTLSAPDFGKIIKCVFPRVKARRLGTRGNSKYCYSGIQRKKNVKPPTLPSLQIPPASDKDKSSTNTANSLSGGDKIEEDQTLSAACLLVCEWANKLLGRVFSTLIELARFLVGGSYVSSKSMAAFVVMSSNDLNTPQISHSMVSLMTPLKQVEEQMLLTQKRRHSQQLAKKLPSRQQQKQIPTNSIIQQGTGLCNTPTQLLGHKTLVSISSPQKPPHKQPLHIQPKPIQPALQSPPAQVGTFYQQQQQPSNPSTSPSSYPPKIRPITPSMISPTTPLPPTVPQTPSPFQSSPKFNTPGTPQNRPVTPGSANAAARHTPNSAEPTRFLFTPIPSSSQEQRINRGETSPLTLRPTATHPSQIINSDWPQQGSQQLGINDVPISPSKQPRLMNQNHPSTPTSNRRPGSFAYPLPSPRTPQRIAPQQYVTSPTMGASPGVGHQLNPVSPNVAQHSQEFMIPIITNVESMAPKGFTPSVNITTTTSSLGNVHISQQHSKQGSPVILPKSCRYSSGTDNAHIQLAPVIHHQATDYSSELESICNQPTSSASQIPPPSYQRSQSVPPLTQHNMADQRFHPLTPQTTPRPPRPQHLTPSPMDTSSQHLNGLKELRNRVLYGDVNNNGSRPTQVESAFSARRNLTPMLNAENSNVNVSNWEVQPVRTNHPNREGENHEMAMLENNLTFADLGNDNDETLSDLNTLDDATTEAVLRNICNNTSGVWPTNDVHAWPNSQALQIMD